MCKSNYVLVTVGHPRFSTGQQVLVRIDGEYTFIDTYKTEAFKIACLNLGLIHSDCLLLDWQFLGEELIIIL